MLFSISHRIALVVVILCATFVPNLRAQGTVRVMPLGDSITYGMGAGPAQIPGGYRDPLAHLYAAGTVPFLLVGSDSTNTTPSLVSTNQQNNEGHTGYRIDQIQSNLNAWQSSANPDVVLLHLGTNDILQNYNLGTGIRFVFKNPDASNGAGSIGNSQAGSAGGTVVRELQAFGTPSASPYNEWAAGYGLAGNDALPQSDPNSNGISNLVEYALGGNPVDGSAGLGMIPVSQIVGDHAQLTFSRFLDRTDIDLTVQGSDDLSDWTDLARSTGGGVFTVMVAGTTVSEAGSGNARSLTVVDPVTVTDPAGAKRFLRVKVSQ